MRFATSAHARALFLSSILLSLACGGARPQAANTAKAEAAPLDWHEGRIAWLSYPQALERAQAEGKPVLVVLYGHGYGDDCANFLEHVLGDEQVIDAARGFAMVRVDVDAEAALNERLASDVRHVPSVLFFNGAGQRLAVETEERIEGSYTYDFKDPAPLLRGMERARHAGPAAPAESPLSQLESDTAQGIAAMDAGSTPLDPAEVERRKPGLQRNAKALVAVCKDPNERVHGDPLCMVALLGSKYATRVAAQANEDHAEVTASCARSGDCAALAMRTFWGVPPLSDPDAARAANLAASGCARTKDEQLCRFAELFASVQRRLVPGT